MTGKTAIKILLGIAIILVAVICVYYYGIKHDQTPNNTLKTGSDTKVSYEELFSGFSNAKDLESAEKIVAKLKTNPEYTKRAITEICQEIDSLPAEQQQKYILALGSFEDNSSLPKLSVLADSKDTRTKLMAYTAIAKMGTSDAVSVLVEKYGKENDKMAREAAKQYLVKMGREKVIPGLIDALNSDLEYDSALTLLKQTTKKDFQEESRDLTIKKWKEWWEENRHGND